MDAKLSFIHNSSIQVKKFLNEQYLSEETPRGFKNIELQPHQATVVKALIDCEDNRVVSIIENVGFDEITCTPVKVETSAMVLSEPFGSGKTYEILGLILLRPVPRAFPTHANSIILSEIQRTSMQMAYKRQLYNAKKTFTTEIVRKFTGSDALIKPNLIIVGSSVLKQWESAINTTTDLKVFTVGNFYSLRKFYQLYQEKQLKMFDIILLKNGTVTGNFVLSGENPEDIKNNRSLIGVIYKMTEYNCWSRVIYDDFDTIKIPTDSIQINALFTIYVSATTKYISPTYNFELKEYKNIFEAFRERNTLLNEILSDKILFTTFNIRNANYYIERSTNITIIEAFRYVHVNLNNNYIKLIGAMKDVDVIEIMEMLNADAILTVAERLRIKTNSIADIFQKLLDKKYEKYLHDQYVLETINTVRETIETLKANSCGKQHSIAELDIIKSSISKKIVIDCGFYSTALEKLLDEMTVNYKMSKDQNGIAINRVIDNVKEGSCQICCLPLDESNEVFIVRCCGLIVCGICGIKGNQMMSYYDEKLRGIIIRGSCANCKAQIQLLKDLICVDRNFDINSLIKAKGYEQLEELSESPPIPVFKPESTNPKLDSLFKIISGIIPENAEPINLSIPHLLYGTQNIPRDENTARKVLVFANFSETLNIIENFFIEKNIEFMRLCGTYQEKAVIIERFQSCGTVLLINSQQYCSGLNIQFTTDLVYFHKISDKNIEAQVAGRAQRIGRTCNLRIHYLCYENEEI